MSRIIIIPSDGFISIDGVSYRKLDLSFVDPSVHAVQWHGTEGEVEVKDATGKLIENRAITSIVEFQPVLDLWQSLRDAEDAAAAALLLPKTPEQIVATHDARILKAFKYMEKMVEAAYVTVPISGVPYNFSTDKITQENIIGINTAIAVGIPIANPRYWTPKGSPYPVLCTHEELANIGGATLNKKDELYQVYFLHKLNIMMTPEYDDIMAYDFTTGYTV